MVGSCLWTFFIPCMVQTVISQSISPVNIGSLLSLFFHVLVRAWIAVFQQITCVKHATVIETERSTWDVSFWRVNFTTDFALQLYSAHNPPVCKTLCRSSFSSVFPTSHLIDWLATRRWAKGEWKVNINVLATPKKVSTKCYHDHSAKTMLETRRGKDTSSPDGRIRSFLSSECYPLTI